MTNRQLVSDSLKERFGEWVDQRTAKGISTYGEPLYTNNGRSAEQDSFEELIDFCQYQEQSRMELKEKINGLQKEVDRLKSQCG